jgi:putative ABC transport system permease protein
MVRTTGVTIILALSIGLALVMFLALKTVQSRINQVKSSVGNTVTISPAGFSNFSDANNALTTAQLAKVQTIPHVTKLTESVTDRLSTIGAPQISFGGRQVADNGATTSLTSPVKLNAGGTGGAGGGGRTFIRGGGQLPANFTPPVSVLGTNDPSSLDGQRLSIKSGTAVDGSKDANQAMVSTDMATKNNLKVGSSFQAYNTTITVAAIYDSGTQGGNNTVILSLPTVQRLSGQAGDVTSATATVDSIDNLASATTAIQNALGSGNADVQNSQTQVQNAVAPLENIKTISTYSLIGSLVAGGIIIFLTMLMIVRERRREIGVLKAIGSSNIKIVMQFVSESLTLTGMAAVLGVIGGLLLSNPVLKLLVTSSTSSASGPSAGMRGGGFGGGFRAVAGLGGRTLQNLHAVVGYDILLYGLLAAILIAIVGSALPAWVIAKVRPAEVLRGE